MTLGTADISLTTRNARNLWHAGNEAGDGFAPTAIPTLRRSGPCE